MTQNANNLDALIGTATGDGKSAVNATTGEGVAIAPKATQVVKSDRYDDDAADKIMTPREGDDAGYCDADVDRRDFFNLHNKLRPQTRDADECNDEAKLRQSFIDEMQNSGDFASLHRKTRLDSLASMIAARHATKQFVEYAERENERQDGNGDGKPGEGDGEGEADRRAAASKATQDAKQEIEDTKNAAEALGAGSDIGGGGGVPTERVVNIWNNIRNNGLFRQIMNAAGRYMRMSVGLQRMKVSHGIDEVVGITKGDDVARMLPTESTTLATPELQVIWAQNYANKSLFQYDVQGTDTVGRGPIVVCIDESGSMCGDEIVNAKAIALALATIARKQKREFAVVRFDYDAELVEDTQSLEWLTSQRGGGTNYDRPLTLALDVIRGAKTMNKADIVFITDGQCSINDTVREGLAELMDEHKVKLISIFVGCGASPELASLSTRVHEVGDMSAAASDTAAADVLSI